jgi:di/tricarboxylate transporter
LSDSALILVIIGATVALFVWGRFPVMLVALATTMSLYLAGLVSVDQAFAGFGDPLIIFIAGLFVVAAGLEKTGVTAWVGQALARAVGGSPVRLSVFTVVIVAFLAPLISTSGAVAALVPVVMLLALKLGESPSRFLMPLAFAAGAGSKLALTGTAKNVLVSDASYDAGYGGFAFFEFALVGIPLLVGTVLIVALLGRRLLPIRTPASLPADFGRHAAMLVEQYGIDRSGRRFRVDAGSTLVGLDRPAATARLAPQVMLLTVIGARTGLPVTRAPIAVGDVVLLSGSPEALSAIDPNLGLVAEAERDIAETLLNRDVGLAEVVIPQRSPLVGRVVSPGMATEDGDVVLIAVRRQGEVVPPVSHGDVAGLSGASRAARTAGVALEAGDHLLVQGAWAALDERLARSEVLAIDSPDAVRRQAVPMGKGSGVMLAIVAAMVVALAAELLPPSVGVLLAVMAVIGFRILSVEQTYRAIDWNTVVLVAAMLPLSTAMEQSGTADTIADLFVALVGDAGPIGLLAGLFIFTAILGQVISNTATAMILIPIAIAAAIDLDVSAQPVLMSLNVGATAAFLTPVATPANLIVMGPAGYRFGDYWKLGSVLMLLYFCIAVFWVPVVWPL